MEQESRDEDGRAGTSERFKVKSGRKRTVLLPVPRALISNLFFVEIKLIILFKPNQPNDIFDLDLADLDDLGLDSDDEIQEIKKSKERFQFQSIID